LQALYKTFRQATYKSILLIIKHLIKANTKGIAGVVKMELKDTVAQMNSSDYKERFKAEYKQLVIRLLRLGAMLEKWEAGELGYNPNCPYETLRAQYNAMLKYKLCLELRAEYEGIKI
jgi:hypothetical protein